MTEKCEPFGKRTDSVGDQYIMQNPTTRSSFGSVRSIHWTSAILAACASLQTMDWIVRDRSSTDCASTHVVVGSMYVGNTCELACSAGATYCHSCSFSVQHASCSIDVVQRTTVFSQYFPQNSKTIYFVCLQISRVFSFAVGGP